MLKSIDKSSQILVGIGSNCRRPTAFEFGVLTTWKIGQKLTHWEKLSDTWSQKTMSIGERVLLFASSDLQKVNHVLS